MSDVRAVWVNGRRHEGDTGHLSALDRGFTLADGLFETMRAHGGHLFRGERHRARLADGLRRIAIPEPPRLANWIDEAVDRDAREGLAVVRVSVTRGPGPAGLAPPAQPSPTVVITIGAFPEFPASIYEDGLTARLASGRRNEFAITSGLKALAYTDAVVAWIEARHAGADDALFLDTEGHCSEATASNLFAVERDTLVTPPLSCGALPGITRAAVVELAAGIGLSVVERPLAPEELFAADEAFLTSTLRGVAPLVRLDGRPIGAGRPGPVTLDLHARYGAVVRLSAW